jgi:hypothetical protein
MADGATACPSCGAATAGASSAQRGSLPPVQFNLGRLTQTDRIVGVGSLVLFISLFLPWFGADGPFGGEVDGLWHGYMYITLILSLVVIVYMAARAAWNELPFGLPVDPVQALPIITGISLVLTDLLRLQAGKLRRRGRMALRCLCRPGGRRSRLRTQTGARCAGPGGSQEVGRPQWSPSSIWRR